MKVEVVSIYTEELVKNSANKLFIFGENQRQKNTRAKGGGQAIIRPFENALGFCTLRGIGEPWTDKEFDSNMVQIMADILQIKKFSKHYDAVVFPKYGLGTGRASMSKSCPFTFSHMNIQLLEHFDFNNIQYLEVPRF